jgi:hypothetical protein
MLKKLKLELTYNPSTPLLDIYPKKCKSWYNKDICTPRFLTALFIIANYENSSSVLKLRKEF